MRYLTMAAMLMHEIQRAFDDTVLGQGGVTLPVLERLVAGYIARARPPG